MFSKSQAFASIEHEVQIIQHLAGKITADHLSYRPSPAQRSLEELLQYLTVAGIITATNIVTQSWEHAPGHAKKAEQLTLAKFSAAMDDQLRDMQTCLADLDDQALASHQCAMPWGEAASGGEALVNMCLKIMVAYRMQLFLYLKACGVKLGTVNCWAGMDALPA